MIHNKYLYAILIFLNLSCNSRREQESSNYNEDLPNDNKANTIESERYDVGLNNYKNLIKSFKYIDKYQYPDYYAGSYLDNNQLHILVTQNCNSCEKDIEKRIGNNIFSLSIGDYSYNMLNEIINQVNVILENNPQLITELKIHRSGLDEYKNRVSVLLGDISPQNIHKFKIKVINSPAINFEYYGEDFEIEQQ